MRHRSISVAGAMSVAALAILLVGCESIFGVNKVSVGWVAAADVPDTVHAGQAFDVVVRTEGADGCWSKDHTDVKVDGLDATITPYDVDTRHSGVACNEATVELVHTASITFKQGGNATVMINGRNRTLGYVVIVE